MPILRVALDVPLRQLFDYRHPEASAGDIGRCVRVPFAGRQKIGLILEVAAASGQPLAKLKDAGEILRELPALPAGWLRLAEFCSRYYQHPIGEVLSLALPPSLRQGRLPARKGLPAGMPQASALAASEATAPRLLAEQAGAVGEIAASFGSFASFLLFGVTGSGKTEVYLSLIEQALARGLQTLLLVPEIALTPQLQARLAARFPKARLATAHSAMAPMARSRNFIAALRDEVDILLGTRLAVFAPLARLGLIVVDEEHDPSFKQQDGLRYCARDVAVWRAHNASVPIVLGSATPSLESYFHARRHHYRLLKLTRRARAENLPAIRCIDTRREKLREGLSAALIEALQQRLARGEQSLVFLNRRGYAPVLACPACGWACRCQRCAANMVVHLMDRRLRCHHCGAETAIPGACPTCGNADMHAFGRGTQRIMETLARLFPQARLLRVDRDSASTAQKSWALLDEIHGARADIVVGTQMLAKGHDFPRLTLVGVLSADAALFAADFRACERLFAQLMQVGGRSGRAALPGEVVVQTEHPGHPLYQALIANDYERFAQAQLEERQAAGLPPYSFQALLRAECADLDGALDFLGAAARSAAAILPPGVSLYDPVPMRLHRKMALERAQLLIESASRPALQGFLAAWLPLLEPGRQGAKGAQKARRRLRWHIDVDPLDF